MLPSDEIVERILTIAREANVPTTHEIELTFIKKLAKFIQSISNAVKVEKITPDEYELYIGYALAEITFFYENAVLLAKAMTYFNNSKVLTGLLYITGAVYSTLTLSLYQGIAGINTTLSISLHFKEKFHALIHQAYRHSSQFVWPQFKDYYRLANERASLPAHLLASTSTAKENGVLMDFVEFLPSFITARAEDKVDSLKVELDNPNNYLYALQKGPFAPQVRQLKNAWDQYVCSHRRMADAIKLLAEFNTLYRKFEPTVLIDTRFFSTEPAIRVALGEKLKPFNLPANIEQLSMILSHSQRQPRSYMPMLGAPSATG